MSDFELVRLLNSLIRISIQGGLNYLGAWDDSTEYVIGDVVYLNGSGYVAKADNQNENPEDGDTFWQLIAHKGDTGVAGVQGSKGDTGNAGAQGAKGDTGNAGSAGSAGAKGDTGTKGDTGNAGAKGDTGVSDVPGDTGATGPQGDTGVTGSQGAKGDTGSTGNTGAKGDTGNTGAQGDKGDTGTAGAKGDTGNTGSQGAKGDTGNTGSTGAKGDTGTAGAKGDTGNTGAQGDQGDTGVAGGEVSWLGAWATSTVYALDDAVENDGSAYICIQAHTSGSDDEEPGVGANWQTYWSLMVEKGDTGTQGAQGDTGVTGSQGPKGDTGNTGATGAKGDTGNTGAQGDQGDTGSTGSQGPKGDTGNTGAQGDQGDTGSQGAKGDTGNTGSQGDQGDTGITGAQGDFGGDSFGFVFSSTITDEDPGAGKLRFNNATIGSVSQLFIDDTDENATDIQAWLATLDDSSSAINGRLKIFKKSAPENWVVFDVGAMTEATGYWKMAVTYVDHAGTIANDDPIVITFVASGDKGDTGTTGSTGAKGDTGNTGAQGDQGDTGVTGNTGAKGDTGNTGPQGDQGDTGVTGSQGAKGDTGTTGSTGPKGDTGNTGSTGAKGDTGNTGSQGDTGVIGSEWDLDPTPDTDTTANGLKSTMTAGEALAFGDVCYIKSDGKMWKADASAIATSNAVAVALGTISADATGSFLFLGFIRDDSWAWTVGGLVYLSTTAGDFTQTAPSATDEVIQVLGKATHADRIYFNPSLVQVEHT